LSARAFIQDQRARVLRVVAEGGFRTFIGNSGWLLLGQLGTSLLGLVQVALLSRALGKDTYGALVLITTAALTVRQFLSVRVWEWITRDFSAALEQRDISAAALSMKLGLATSACINAAALVLLALLSPLLEAYVLKGAASSALAVAFGGTFIGSFANDTCASVLRASGRFRYLAVQGVVAAAGRLAVLATAAWTTRGLEGLVAAYVAIELVFGAWLLAATSRSFRASFGTAFWQVRTPPILPALREQRGRLFFAGLLDTLKLASARVDLLFLGVLTTPASVAVYQVAFNFIDGVGRLATPVTLVLFNDLARSSARNDSSSVLRIIRRTRLAGMAAGALVGLALFTLANPLVQLVSGESYREAASVLRVLALTLPFWLSTLWMQPTFASLGKLQWSLELLVLATLLKLALMVMLVPRYAELGLAAASAAFYALPALLVFFYFGRVRRFFLRAPSN
jgi:O-antigen/teichoic acid export membrane protein